MNCQSIVRAVFQRDSQILTFCFLEKDIFDGLTVILKKIRAVRHDPVRRKITAADHIASTTG